MISTEIANASKIMIGSTEASAMYIGSEKLWPVDLHEYVEIGGIKWATMNIGANSVTDYGLYFQWGDTQGYTAAQVGSGSGKKYFSWADYKYGNGTSSPRAAGITKYNASDGKTVLEESDDAARANWGDSWRMPTKYEWAVLGAAVNTAWTASYQGSGVAGLVCTDKTDSSKVLFFPAAGYCLNGSVDDVGNRSFYWSRSLYSSDVQCAYSLLLNSSNTKFNNYSGRNIGFPVRGMIDIPQHDYSLDYLTFTAVEDGTFTFTGTTVHNSLSYSLDEGITWVALASGVASPTVQAGNKIYWKGAGLSINNSSTGGIGNFSSTNIFDVSGNPMSLYYGSNFKLITRAPAYIFVYLFNKCSKLRNAVNLSLPATTVSNSSYCYMFSLCSNLITAPALPATTLATYCYRYMFMSCSSLTIAPELPATTLASNCYNGMFYYCSSLTTAPELPATTLSLSCYSYMFRGCTRLTTAPVLPATTLVNYCYLGMFQGCTSLSYIKAMFKTTPGLEYTPNWVNGVAASGTFVKNSAATWNSTGVNGIPSRWTVLTSSS